MRKLKTTSAFRKDLKKLNTKEAKDTTDIIVKLQKDEVLEEKFRDHALHGNYAGFRECHVHPDLLLVYKKGSENEILILTLYRISSHTNIFDINKSKK
jgi:mRNA interferase YafQ